MKSINSSITFLLLVAAFAFFPLATFAQGTTAFTYQGRLNNGANLANGLYDFQFTVYSDSIDLGSIVSGPYATPGVSVSNGLFTVTLDYGAIFDGRELWLGIEVRTNGGGAFISLTPFQPFTPTPYALYTDQAAVANQATYYTGKIAASQITGTLASSNVGVGTITASNLAPGAVAANLAASGVAGVPSSGIVLSEMEINSSLLSAGFLPIGTAISVAGEAWTGIPNGPPSTGSFNPGRYGHKAVWTGSLVLFIGGNPDNAGLRYSPSANTWTVMNKSGAPTVGDSVLVGWTGTLLIVWDPYHRVGGRYNPTTDAWTAMSATGAPIARNNATAAWTGTYLVVWGGHDENSGNYFSDGARYNPTTDTWTAISSAGAPPGRDDATAVWSGTEVVVFGGKTNLSTLTITGPSSSSFNGYWGLGSGGRYNPTTDTWGPVAASSPRFNHAAVWTGSRMIVYGGFDHDGVGSFCAGIFCNYSRSVLDPPVEGASYNPANNTWTTLGVSGAPANRANHVAVWDGTHMFMWGGETTNNFVSDGASYTPASDTWSALPAVGSAARIGHAAVWTGTQMVWWGGKDSNGSQLSDGLRYTLAGNTWSTTTVPPASGEPAERAEASSIWTGNQLIVWGGINNSTVLRSGGIYTPGIGWTNLPDNGAPSARVHHTAVWSGTEMIIWGGESFSASAPVNSGARFNVSSNRWFPISTINAPRARTRHSAVWTGKEMIVWGGYDYTNLFFPIFPITGGRYNPALDLWTPITNNLFFVNGRERHTAVWTGTNMLVWGGFISSGGLSPTLNFYNDGYSYDPTADVWSFLPAAPLTGRRSHAGVWTGNDLLVWGGYGASGPTNNGARYNPAGNVWTLLSTSNAPTARLDHSAVWANAKGQMIVWGGTDNTSYFNSGALYDPLTDKWTAITNNNSGLLGRSTHGAVWTGTSMIALDGAGLNFGSFTNFSDGAAFTPRKLFYLYQKP